MLINKINMQIIINSGQGEWLGAILCTPPPPPMERIVDHVGARSYVSFRLATLVLIEIEVSFFTGPNIIFM